MAAMANARPTGHRITPHTRTDVGEPSDPAIERPTPRAMKAAAINRPAVMVSTNACPYFLNVERSCSIP